MTAMSERGRLSLALVLCVAGALASWALLLQHHGEAWGRSAVAAVCGDGTHAETACDVVNRSSYSSVAGVPLSAAGLVFYTSLGSLILLGWLAGRETSQATARWGFFVAAAALVVDAVLLAIQAFSLKAFCRLCLFTYALNVALLLLLRSLRGGSAEARPPDRREGRVVVGGWVLATLASVAAALGFDQALIARQADRERNVLGPAASTMPADASALAAEVKRLKETLDDPEKRQKYDAEKAISDFDKAPVQQVDVSKSPIAGPPGAPITVVEYSDFMCPFCRNIAGAFHAYLPESQGRVRIAFKSYPLDKDCNPSLQQTIHAGACRLALGGVCAQAQDRFWPYHDKVFGTEWKDPQMDDVVKAAAQAGLDATAFEACLKAPATLARLKEDITEGQRVGVQGTPTLLLNGKRMPRVNDFIELVARESKRLGLPEAPPMLARPTQHP